MSNHTPNINKTNLHKCLHHIRNMNDLTPSMIQDIQSMQHEDVMSIVLEYNNMMIWIREFVDADLAARRL